MDVLIHISQQLSNSTILAFEPTAFQVSSNAAAVNMLFFLSLAFVLIDAFLAMLVKGWLQEFDRGWRAYTVAHLRAQERERRLQELERWKLHEIVALLPILIQWSLLLFCVGLIVLISPLHLPSAILFTLTFVGGVGFYGFTTYVSIANKYAPFSSPVSRLLARVVAIIARNARRIASAIPSLNFPLPPAEGQQADSDASGGTTPPLPLNNDVARPAQPHRLNGVGKGKLVPRSRSDIDPQTHVRVLERLVATTAEAVENIPIFLELLDQPVKDATLRPLNVERWRSLLHITLGLLREQSTLPVSAACTLARTMMICYNRETADQQLCHLLRLQLGRWGVDDSESRVPLHRLFSFYFDFWLNRFALGASRLLYSLSKPDWRTIAFLEPSNAADAELLWMVNTFHSTMESHGILRENFRFLVAVLAYVSSTEQSRRSQVPLTAAVIYAVHTIRAASDQQGSGSIDHRYVLPGIVSTSESVPMTFCQVDGINTLDLWSEDCIQFIKDLLQWYRDDDFQLSLIAALYYDSTKHAHARTTFGDLLKYTHITNIRSQFSDAYDHGKLAVFWYMALSQKPLDMDGLPLAGVYHVIESTISMVPTPRLTDLHIMEIAVKYVHKTASLSSDWLEKETAGLRIIVPGEKYRRSVVKVENWVLLHLDTLLATQLYLPAETVKSLTWSDTPEKVHIAKARLDLYDNSAEAGREGAIGPKPDPELLRVFLWSEDRLVCTRTFKWCLDLASISQPALHGDTSSTPMFIPGMMGYQWTEHFVHVLCQRNYWTGSWDFLFSHLVPKWTTLPSSWCRDFASALLFSTVETPDPHGLPAYQYFTQTHKRVFGESSDRMDNFWRKEFLPFFATLLESVKSSLTWTSLTSLEDWWAQALDERMNRDTPTQMEQILATTRQQLVEGTVGLFQELPFVGSWVDE